MGSENKQSQRLLHCCQLLSLLLPRIVSCSRLVDKATLELWVDPAPALYAFTVLVSGHRLCVLWLTIKIRWIDMTSS